MGDRAAAPARPVRPDDRVAAAARATPDAVAVVAAGGDALSFAQWDAGASAVAAGLAGRGVGPGDRVALRFDLAAWGDFAVCHLGVRRAGAVAVLVSPGAAAADAARAVVHAGAVGVLSPPHLGVDAASAWCAAPADLDADAAPPVAVVDPDAVAELLFRPAPLGSPAPEQRTFSQIDAPPAPPTGGALVHGWAPGTAGSRYALSAAAAGGGAVVAVPALSPERVAAAVAAHPAAAVGLSPPLAAALAATPAGRAALRPVTRILLSGRSTPVVARAFPGAAVVEVPGCRPLPAPATAAPVAVSQEPMLWHEQLAPGSFNLPCLVRRFEGPLDVAALAGALADLVRRHEPLRTTFTSAPGVPRQVVRPAAADPLAVVDLSALPPERREAEAARVLTEASVRPFDLVDGPLFEPSLLRLGDEDHVLVVRLHHTVFDDWSVDLFRRDLSALYAARLDASTPALAEPATTFTTFSRRQRAALDGASGAEQRAWWRRELDGAPLAVQLPLGGPPDEGAGEPVRVDLPTELSAAVRALGPHLRATPYMAVLAAFGAVVGRYTGQDDLVLGTVSAHRTRSAVEPLIGCFTKKVPLRLRLDGDPPFRELVARARAAVLGAMGHQDVGFDAVLQETLGPPAAEHGAVPQIAVVFQGEAPRRAPVGLPGVRAGPFDVPPASRRERHFSAREGRPAWGDGLYLGTFVLVSLVEHDDGLSLVARGAFPRPAGRRLLGQVEALLADVVVSPDRPVSELSLGPEPVPAAGDGDLVDVRGLRGDRARLEAALARCPGVADVGLAVPDGHRLVAYVVPMGDRAPSLAELRRTLWTQLPGALWPAAAVTVDEVPRRPGGRPDPSALPPPPPPSPRPGSSPGGDALAALWGVAYPDRPYWQDFSFLDALAEARQAGLAVSDEQVARNRTVATLAADLEAGA